VLVVRDGRLGPWVWAGTAVRLRGGRGADPAAGPACCYRAGARRADGIEVIGAAAELAMAGAGHRAAALGVPAATVRGWLRRLCAKPPSCAHTPSAS
jgi:hypothetical protein